MQAPSLPCKRLLRCPQITCLLLNILSVGILLGQDTAIRLTDATATSGITFVHSNGGYDQGYIVEGMSTGIVTFDYDGDGLVDIYFLNGSPLKGTPPDDQMRNALYRNLGGGKFEDVTDASGTGDRGYALGASAADYDGDGDLDLYVNNFGRNALLRNNGDQTFTDVTTEAGVDNGEKVGAGVGFFDMDQDGDLDLYVANYVNFNYDNHVPIEIEGARFQAGPQFYKPVPDNLYRNNGDGTFTDVSQASGISSVSGPGMGLVCADLDNDGDVDLYVCNDGQPNFLFLNDGTGKFEELGMLYGAACDFDGKANSSMGVDCGDYDHDGLLDLIVTNYQAEMPVLYHNLGDGLFEDATSSANITRNLYPHVNWGTAFVDFDNDGDEDIFMACGHFDRIEQIDDRTTMKIKNFVLENENGRFRDVTDASGAGENVDTSRGAAFEDFDNDGDIDVIILNSNGGPTLLRNDSQTENAWLKIRLRQPGMNQLAIGARVTVRWAGKSSLTEVLSGRGYQSHFGDCLHFGLGGFEGDTVNVEVRWPDGESQRVDLAINQQHEIERTENTSAK